MKKQIIKTILPMMILFIGMTIAVEIAISDRDIEMPKDQRDALVSLNLDTHTTYDYEQDGLSKRCLYKADAINTCSDYIDKSLLDEWQRERLEGIALAEIERQAISEEVLVAEGITTVKEKK